MVAQPGLASQHRLGAVTLRSHRKITWAATRAITVQGLCRRSRRYPDGSCNVPLRALRDGHDRPGPRSLRLSTWSVHPNRQL
jgi:hypothetical protein